MLDALLDAKPDDLQSVFALHDDATFDDELVKTPVAGGIFWAVRREHPFE